MYAPVLPFFQFEVLFPILLSFFFVEFSIFVFALFFPFVEFRLVIFIFARAVKAIFLEPEHIFGF